MGPIFNQGGFNGGPGTGVSLSRFAYDAMRELGCMRTGQTPNADTVADVLRHANLMLDAWALERLLIPRIVRQTYSLTSGQATYGLGGNVEDRPVQIVRACLIPSGSTEEQKYDITDDRYLLSGSPSRRQLHCDYNFPSAEVTISPAPSSGDTLVLYVWGQLTRWTSADEVMYFAPGYQLAILFNLALQLSSSFAYKAKSPVLLANIAEQANRARAAIKRVNLPRPKLSSDTPRFNGGGFDFASGGFR